MPERKETMKRIAFIITLLSVYFCAFVGVSAAPDQKNADVTVSDTPAVLNVGETVILTAATGKHGSSYNDNWNNAVKSITEFDPNTGTYISKAEFTAQKAGIYTISYNIDMFAGKSGIAFSGKAERTIKVISPVTIIGADIRDLVISPFYKADGSIKSYSASGTTYAIWSDNTAKPYSSIFFFFGPDETAKDINVTLNINSIQYTYTVAVKR